MADDFKQLSDDEKNDLLQQQQQRIAELETQLSRQVGNWSPLSADDFLRDLLDTLPLILFATDIDGNLLFSRGSGLQAFDIAEDSNNGENIFQLYDEENELLNYVRRALDGERINAVQVTVRELIYQAYYFPLHNADRKIIGMTAIITDVNVLKRTEKALRESERLLRAIFDLSYHFIALIDMDGSMLDVNQTAMQLTTVSYEKTIGTKLWELAVVKDDSTRYRLRESVEMAKHGETVELEFDLHDQRRDKMLTIDFSIQPIYDDKRDVSVLLAEGRDITERKKVEEAIDRAFRRERELSDLKSRFITTTSHEFRTPLAIISSSAFLLQRHYERLSATKREQHFHKIQNNVEHIAAMLDDILLLGQLQSRTWDTHITQINLNHLVYNAVQYFRTLNDQTHTIEMSLPPTVIQIDGDERLLQQLLINLLRNAVLFSPDGGLIDVELDATQQESIVLRVTDSGIGIPKNEQPLLYDVFFRASNAENIPGRGLGLSIVRDVLRLHHGHISLQSTPGDGSTFTVRLPKTTSG